MKTQLKSNWDYLLRTFYSKELVTIIWVCQRFKGRQEVGKLYKEKKRTRVLLCSEWKVLLEESWRKTNEKQDIFCDRYGKHIWCSIVGPKLKVGQKHKKGGGMLAVIDHVLTILDGLLLRLWFGFLGWLLWKLQVQVLLPYMVWPSPLIYSASHSVFNTHWWLLMAKIPTGLSGFRNTGPHLHPNQLWESLSSIFCTF